MKSLQKPIKIVFFDIDDTLYVKHKAYIPKSITEQVLPRLKAKGIIPAIATGRNHGCFPEALKPYLNPETGFELFVTINGQYNFYKDQMISDYSLSREQIERIIEKANALGIPYAFITPMTVAVSATNPIVHEAVLPITPNYLIDPHYYEKEKIVQMLLFYTEEQKQAVENSGIFANDLKEARWHSHAVDILRKENSKARGIQDVLATLNIEIENAMAFGDGINDLEMLPTVGVGVAMGNGVPELKAVADFITKPIEEDGILYALETLEVI
ncbi:Putative bifunctional phosphatase/peptidyl-prolyl cis-trans isomerase [Mannheimia haemolytica]|uniref:Bifunctional phosphatase/peptidyl-prolyl cis-trans isomerase n=1 Tax=Mannheimia haemolytica TaxID=75985 RepID=A0A3S5B0U7_MANHA|nr:Cof-type HAD-IIB family hydrolase [Mannheimia haemolytica]VEI74574.1 Putative bifunctional phosphatase/peptidyl-prolyl cis-trans isomerase [Mannheimia haemolytica]HDV7283596.1 Cof-type HAD-IIB family hydrolase [Mannheimia haemolytica]